MTDELKVTAWSVVEAEDTEQVGFVVIPADKNVGAYIAKSPVLLFATETEAKDVVTHLTRQGMAIGSLRIAAAKLSHHRKLEISTDVQTPTQKIII